MSIDRPGCLGKLLGVFGLLPKQEEWAHEVFPYAKRDDFLSPAELSFYKVLKQVMNGTMLICPKVSLRDIFFVRASDRSKKTTYLNKIDRKHVDFLLCKVDNMEPVCGIELDDSSHNREDRIQRDKFFDQVFTAAGLKLLRFKTGKSYTLSEIATKLSTLNNNSNNTRSNSSELLEVKSQASAATGKPEIPLCPKCGIPLVLRTSKKGDNKGQAFYGCTNFPKCREIVSVKNE